jgi:hypothetical protein
MLRADTQTWMLGRIYEISSTIPQEIREGRREAREDAREIRRILRSQDRRLARMESKGGSDALKIEKWILRTLTIGIPALTLLLTGDAKTTVDLFKALLRLHGGS